MKIVISHGSGGVGSAETYTKNFFEERGFGVILIDYFTPHGITNLRWHDTNPDLYDVTFEEMFDVEFPQGDLVHIGFSLGGFFGLYHTEKFKHNYLFYPGVVGFTKEMTEKDYTNCHVIFGTEDTGKYKYDNFKSYMTHPPKSHYLLTNTHHAFMVSGIDRSFDMVRYNCSEPMSKEDFSQLKPNNDYMSRRYGKKSSTQTLKSNLEFRDLYLNKIYGALIGDHS